MSSGDIPTTDAPSLPCEVCGKPASVEFLDKSGPARKWRALCPDHAPEQRAVGSSDPELFPEK